MHDKQQDEHKTVLVTGGSGFLGSHTIVQLLNAGYRVITTVRSIEREAGVRELVRSGGIEDDSKLSFAIADLTQDDAWSEIMEGRTYVLHTASPFPGSQPKDEDELIIPARDGALRVLKAADKAGVKRVVMTSSFAAVGYSPKSDGLPYTESDWTNPDQQGIDPYVKSKTIAELAAWDYVNSNASTLELTVINPTGIFGPILGADFSSSIMIIKNMLEGKIPLLPNVAFGVADVRDVAVAHISAMTNPNAAGERFIVTGDSPMSFMEIAEVLKKGLGNEAVRVSTDLGSDASYLKRPVISNEKAKRVLSYIPRSGEDVILATGKSLFEYGVID